MTPHGTVLQSVTASDICLTPFPHLVVRDVLPEAYYAELAEQFPSLRTVAGGDALPNNTLFLRAAETVEQAGDIAPVWRGFFSDHTSGKFFDEMVELWGRIILQLYPDIEQWFGRPLAELSLGIRAAGQEDDRENYRQDVQMDCQFAVNSPVTEATSVRGPHVDRRHKLFATLLYLPLPGDQAGGDLTLYRYKDPRLAYDPGQSVPHDFVEQTALSSLGKIPLCEVTAAKTIAYQANTLVMWLNSPYSIHGVTPRSTTNLERRYVNMIGEAYRSGQEGFFQLKKQKKTLRQRMFGS